MSTSNGRWGFGPGERINRALSKVVRVPTRGEIRGVIVSRRPWGCFTHWINGHTQPCYGEKCDCVEKKTRSAWKTWVQFWCTYPREWECILEIPATAASEVERLYGADGSVRGRSIKLIREGDRPNGPVRLFVGEVRPEKTLPSEVDVSEIMDRIFSGGYRRILSEPDSTNLRFDESF